MALRDPAPDLARMAQQARPLGGGPAPGQVPSVIVKTHVHTLANFSFERTGDESVQINYDTVIGINPFMISDVPVVIQTREAFPFDLNAFKDFLRKANMFVDSLENIDAEEATDADGST